MMKRMLRASLFASVSAKTNLYLPDLDPGDLFMFHMPKKEFGGSPYDS
jgi:hypothetical protein